MTYVCPHCGEEHPDHFRLLQKVRLRGLRRELLTLLLWSSPRAIDHEAFMDKHDLGPSQLSDLTTFLRRRLKPYGYTIPTQQSGRRAADKNYDYAIKLIREKK
jgi:hypothetical protein